MIDELMKKEQMLKDQHGGNIYKASEHLNMPVDSILDFSANINPLGIPKTLKEILVSNINSLVNYPDPDYTKLRKQLSGYIDVSYKNIIPGNGSSEIIFLLLKALKPQNILIPAPCFLEYEKASEDAKISAHYFKLEEEDDFKLDIEKFINKLKSGVKCILLCNPNNPTSTLISKDDMQYILKSTYRYGVMMIVDEAFIELTLGGSSNSVTQLIQKYSNLFVIRAFTKAFAVPGLRLGYGIGSEDIIKKMHLIQQPWSVNALASCAGDFLPSAEEYLKKTQIWLADEKEWLFKGLSSIPYLKVYEPQTNFILAKLTKTGQYLKSIKIQEPSKEVIDIDAAALRESMSKKGILIRNASNFRFLDKHYLRVAVKDRKSNECMIKALRDIINFA